MGGWRGRDGPRAPLEEVLVPSSGARVEPVHCLFPEAQAYRIEELRRGQSDEGGEAMLLFEVSMKESTMMSAEKPLIARKCYT